MTTSAAHSPPSVTNRWNERIHAYKKQRRFAYISARCARITQEESDDTMNLLRGLNRNKCTVYTLAYEHFLIQTTLKRSHQSLKLMLLDIEAGLRDPIYPHDEQTVCILIDEITIRQRSTANNIHTTHKSQTSAQKHVAPPPPPPAKRRAVPLATNITFEDMMKKNIEALQYYMTTLLTTDDYMKFVFTNKDIEARFHRYINNILVHKSDGEKYLQLEEHINNRLLLMDKLSQMPQTGQTFLLPDFANRVFAVPCSKDEYMKKYCQDNDFRLPPGKEILTQPPSHPGLYRRTMTGLKQIDPNCRIDTTRRQNAFGRGKRIH